MEFTEQDRDVLHRTWMSHKAKMRITQIEMAKRLKLSQLEFSNKLRGDIELDRQFIQEFCGHMSVDPTLILPSLRDNPNANLPNEIQLTHTYTVDGEITNVRYQGNQLVVEFSHTIKV